MTDAHAEPSRAPSADAGAALLEAVLAESGLADDHAGHLGPQLVMFLEELGSREGRPRDVETLLSEWIADVDALLSAQVNEILHAPAFQALEASWRGLHLLVSGCETGARLKVRVLNAPKQDLRKDLENAVEFDQSAFFKKVYEEEYGMYGGAPFGVLIGDYEFSNHPQDIVLLERCANVGAAAHAPFLGALSPAFFGWESFEALGVPRDLQRILTGPEYARWNAFRDTDDSRYAGLVLPRILVREPYRPETAPVEAFTFTEDVDDVDHRRYLWGNAAYALGIRIADAFVRFGWCAAIRGVDGGGLVEELPAPSFTTDDPRLALKGPTELALTDRREKELADLGLIPLVHCKGTGYAAFFSTQSCQKPKRYDTEEANANARLSAQLQYILSTSRFAHYIKVMMRDKTGSVMTAHDCEDFLQRWIVTYCLANPESVGLEGKARRPLRDARISVREVPGKPGSYVAVAHLQPHFQLDELTVSLRLVAELPKPANAA
jgi:type VI secretion system protein ImpC